MKKKYTERGIIEIISCGHGRNVASSNCSFCKSRMIILPKKKIKNYKHRYKHINWSESYPQATL